MGFFSDFFRKRREAKERRRVEMERRRTEEERKKAELVRKRAEERAKRERLRRERSYERIHSWIESRIGKMNGAGEEELHHRVLELIDKEQERVGKTFTSGLEAYIKTNAYRKMLGGEGDEKEAIMRSE